MNGEAALDLVDWTGYGGLGTARSEKPDVTKVVPGLRDVHALDGAVLAEII